MTRVPIVILAVDRLPGPGNLLSKPRLVATALVDTADNILGARDIIALAFADLQEHEYLIVARASVAKERGWESGLGGSPKEMSTQRPEPSVVKIRGLGTFGGARGGARSKTASRSEAKTNGGKNPFDE